jgi:hypothetical protein
MYFDNHTDFPNAKINLNLFWEYDLKSFDFQKQISIVVQRVVERGIAEDFFALYNLYGREMVDEVLRQVPAFSQRDLEFINNVLEVPYSQLLAYQNLKLFANRWPHRGVPVRL